MKTFLSNCNNACSKSCLVKSVRIWSYSGPYFPTFGLNTERYSISLRIQSECGKIKTRKTPNTDHQGLNNDENSVVLESDWLTL